METTARPVRDGVPGPMSGLGRWMFHLRLQARSKFRWIMGLRLMKILVAQGLSHARAVFIILDVIITVVPILNPIISFPGY